MSTPNDVPAAFRNMMKIEELIQQWRAVSGGQPSPAGTLAEWLGARCVCVDRVTNDAVREAFDAEGVWQGDGVEEGDSDERMRRAFARLTVQ